MTLCVLLLCGRLINAFKASEFFFYIYQLTVLQYFFMYDLVTEPLYK